jgi:phospholipid/cholesterol/gamma-HCH transport system substrate-binding protein
VETRANYVLVGSSVLAAIAAIIIFIFWLGRNQLSKHEDIYHTYFTGSVTGLSSGSPVRYRGVPVGTVGYIAIDPDNIERIRVTLKLRPHTPIKTDTVASLETAGITGGAYIELSGGTQASPLLLSENGEVPVIKSENSSLQSLVDDAPKLLSKLNQLSDQANKLLSNDNVKTISATFDHLNNLSANLDALGPDAKQTIANLNKLTTDLNKQLPALMDTFKQDGTSIRDAANEFHKVGSSLDSVITENRAPLRDFAANGLSEVGTLVANLRTLTDTLNRVADHLDRDPQRYLFGGTSAGIDPSRPLSSGIATGAPR